MMGGWMDGVRAQEILGVGGSGFVVESIEGCPC